MWPYGTYHDKTIISFCDMIDYFVREVSLRTVLKGGMKGIGYLAGYVET